MLLCIGCHEHKAEESEVGKIAGNKGYLNIEAKFLCGDKVYSGIASHLSLKMMRIYTKLTFPLEFKNVFEVLIIFNKKRVIIPVKIMKFIKTDCFYDAIEVEILTPPKEYLAFIGKAKFHRPPYYRNISSNKPDTNSSNYPARDC